MTISLNYKRKTKKMSYKTMMQIMMFASFWLCNEQVYFSSIVELLLLIDYCKIYFT